MGKAIVQSIYKVLEMKASVDESLESSLGLI